MDFFSLILISKIHEYSFVYVTTFFLLFAKTIVHFNKISGKGKQLHNHWRQKKDSHLLILK